MTTQNLNPVRIMTVQDWKQLAEDTGYKFAHYKEWQVVQLQQRYESEVFKTLERKHFVCEVEKLNIDSSKFKGRDKQIVEKAIMVDENLHQSDLIFEGFESEADYAVKKRANPREEIVIVGNGYFHIDHRVWDATIFDFIYNVHKYNETATNKIELKFTEAFIKKIIQ